MAENPGRARTDLLEPVPSWITDGWYGNNPGLQKLAMIRYRMPVTSAAERHAAHAFTPAPAHPCASCGRFAFARADVVCFHCRRGRTT